MKRDGLNCEEREKNEKEKYRLMKGARGGASVRKSEIKQVVDLPALTCRVPGVQECATKLRRFNTLKEKHIKHEYKRENKNHRKHIHYILNCTINGKQFFFDKYSLGKYKAHIDSPQKANAGQTEVTIAPESNLLNH